MSVSERLMNLRMILRAAVGVGLLAALGLCTGCFSERAFPAAMDRIVRVTPAEAPRNARAWVAEVEPAIEQGLGRRAPRALTTAELVDAAGAPIDVFAAFGRDPDSLHTLLGNLSGLEDSAQATGPDSSADAEPTPWPGFEDVIVPVDDSFAMVGRLGLARGADGEPIASNAVIILPGLFGDLRPARTRDVAMALRASGIHTLAVDLRGMGRTQRRHPDAHYSFGILESDDLIAAAVWLQQMEWVRETGMVGFCWGANHALLTAWRAATPAKDATHLSPAARALMRPLPDEPVFRAGMLACSPVMRCEETIEATGAKQWGMLENPVLEALQGSIDNFAARRGHPDPHGSLWWIIRYEYDHVPGLDYDGAIAGALDYVRVWPHEGKTDGDKFARMSLPVLILQAANDPLTSAQYVADLAADCGNPNVAAVVLEGGGHIGFAPFARDCFYSLLVNWFDPAVGPAPTGDWQE